MVQATHDAPVTLIPVQVGGYAATVSAPSDIAPAIRSALRDVVVAQRGPRGAAIVISRSEGGYRITVDGVGWAPPHEQVALDQLIYVLHRATLDAEAAFLHLHAGYVALAGQGVLIAGFPGSGKSTLVARLVESGFDFLTDERVGIDQSSGLHPLPLPISLVQSSFEVLPHLAAAGEVASGAPSTIWHIPASSVRAGSVTGDASLKAIVFVQFDMNAPTLTNQIHPAEATRLLLSDSPDVGRFGGEGVALAMSLCAMHRCVKLVFGDGADAVRVIRDIVTGPARAHPATVNVLPRSFHIRRPRLTTDPQPDLDGDSVLGRPADVSGACVEGRCVLLREAAGELVELDETASAWIQLLDGRSSLADIIRDAAAESALAEEAITDAAFRSVRELIEVGVLE